MTGNAAGGSGWKTGLYWRCWGIRSGWVAAVVQAFAGLGHDGDVVGIFETRFQRLGIWEGWRGRTDASLMRCTRSSTRGWEAAMMVFEFLTKFFGFRVMVQSLCTFVVRAVSQGRRGQEKGRNGVFGQHRDDCCCFDPAELSTASSDAGRRL